MLSRPLLRVKYPILRSIHPSRATFSHFTRLQLQQQQQQQKQQKEDEIPHFTPEGPSSWATMGWGQRIVRVTTSSASLVFIIGGVSLFAGCLYLVGSELFSSDSATHLFDDTLTLLQKHPEIIAQFGTPVRGFGEPSHSRARRNRHVSSQEYLDPDGHTYWVMRFYIRGPKSIARAEANEDMDPEGVVHISASRAPKGWSYAKLYVDTPEGKRIHIIHPHHPSSTPTSSIPFGPRRTPASEPESVDQGQDQGQDQAPKKRNLSSLSSLFRRS